ncbi:hypothetical protein DBB29_24635 [Pandoraea cepalis]|uniref:Uncharacterized protein n=1 Tax=Pandoraea cepalis TaxID=2508294 RepID=A0AAW7MGL1_9BURK|nr:hypothetical protein [Pandoraea cepalis]MDN4571849.1 hypothetical protein [Pandoraea cepalis]MDN4581303.1 hypothetical protein [Pandoraea cepalis]
MPKIVFSEVSVSNLKKLARLLHPEIKSTHLSEALAYAHGFNTHAALLAALRAQPAGSTVAVDAQRFSTRLNELGYACPPGFSFDPLVDILSAINAQGMPGFTTPSGPILDTLTDLLAAGQLREANGAYRLFAKAHPDNATFVAGLVPAKVLNRYWWPRLEDAALKRWEAWTGEHASWAANVVSALENGDLDGWTKRALTEMNALDV